MKLGGIIALCFLSALPLSCSSKKAKYPLCAKDQECKKGEYCIQQKCQQCGPGKACANKGKCLAGQCKPANYCRDDSECLGGQICNNAACSPCLEDRECGPEQRCANGACLQRGACNAHTDCAEEEDCINGLCQRPGRQKAPALSCQFSTVFFNFDEFTVLHEFSAVLENNANCIKQALSRTVFVNGFTDHQGTEEYNIALSEKRASAVADYLARLGVDPAQLKIIPRGESGATGSSEASYAKDRKVELEWQ